MEYKRYFLVLIFLLHFCVARSQVLTYEQADSTSNALLESANWTQLIKLGERSIDSGIDFPAMRSRLGYARLMTGNYSAALREYAIVFKNDSYNQDARYYDYLCHLYLNQQQAASLDARYLDQTQLNTGKIDQFAFLNAGLESGIKYTDNYYRGNAFYNRISLSNRLSWRWQLDQSFFYFNQPIQFNFPPDGPNGNSTTDRQTEYYGKLSYALTGRTMLWGSYHYLNTYYKSIFENSNIGSVGIKYTGTYFDINADVNFGYMIDHALKQYNAGFFLYPGGNLNFYAMSRFSLLDQKNTNHIIFSQSAGFKIFKNTWLETCATFGKLDNFIGEDGLYVYNSIDVSSFMFGETAYFQLSKHIQLRLIYTIDNKKDEPDNLNYHQYSATAGIIWKF